MEKVSVMFLQLLSTHVAGKRKVAQCLFSNDAQVAVNERGVMSNLSENIPQQKIFSHTDGAKKGSPTLINFCLMK